MIGSKTVIGIITARSGSKGLPGKNILDFGGKPLINWTILAAQKSKFIDHLILSTDDIEIANVARKLNCGVPFMRPSELAGDDTSSEDVLIHALDNIDQEFGYLVLLQPTSPFRLAKDIDGCLEQCRDLQSPVCVSITEPDKSPYWMVYMDEQNRLHQLLKLDTPVSRRQDLPASYALNGAVYVAEVEWFRTHRKFLSSETVGYVMPKERSIDIDTPFDLEVAKLLIKNKELGLPSSSFKTL